MNHLNGMRILVTEDEWLVALSLDDMLSRFGCEVLGPCPELSQALQVAELEALDAAVLDINLRGESVFPLAETLLDRNIPLIFCSGYADRSMLPGRFAACGRLAKPYGEAELRAYMEDHLVGRRQVAATSHGLCLSQAG